MSAGAIDRLNNRFFDFNELSRFRWTYSAFRLSYSMSHTFRAGASFMGAFCSDYFVVQIEILSGF